MSLAFSLALVPVLIALNAFFVVGEYTVVALRPAQIQRLVANRWKRTASAVQKLKDDPSSSIGAIQVCITMTNLLLGWIGEPAMSMALGTLLGGVLAFAPSISTPVSVVLSFLTVTFFTVVFSELLPKAMTLRYLEPAAIATAVPMLAIRTAIHPLVWLMNQTANLVTRPLGLGRVEQVDESVMSPDELRLLATQAADDGVISPRERTLILNALSVGTRRLKEILVPRCASNISTCRSRWTTTTWSSSVPCTVDCRCATAAWTASSAS